MSYDINRRDMQHEWFFALQAIDGVSKVLLRISIVTMDYHGLKPPMQKGKKEPHHMVLKPPQAWAWGVGEWVKNLITGNKVDQHQKHA